MKKHIPVLFLLLALGFLLGGCNKQDENGSLLNTDLSGVYRTTEIQIPDRYYVDLFTAPDYSDGTFSAQIYEEGYLELSKTISFFDI